MQRRTFLQQAISSTGIASPLISPSWKPSAPRSYIAELSRLMRAAPVPGAVIAVVEGRKLAWVAPLGVLTEGSPAPVTESSLFEAASLTKPLVAYAAFALRDAGKFDFDKPLVEYLDDLPNAAAHTVTARHVMSHTSGFVNWRSAPADLTPSFQPGAKFQYSGEGFFYLQRMIERIHGSGIEQALQDLVIKPLGMTSSTLIWDPATLSRTASPHDNHGEVQQNWDKPARRLRAYAEKIGKPVATLAYDDYAAVTRDAGSPVLPGWMNPKCSGRSDHISAGLCAFRYWLASLCERDSPGANPDQRVYRLGFRLGYRTHGGQDVPLAFGRQRRVQKLRDGGAGHRRCGHRFYEWRIRRARVRSCDHACHRPRSSGALLVVSSMRPAWGLADRDVMSVEIT